MTSLYRFCDSFSRAAFLKQHSLDYEETGYVPADIVKVQPCFKEKTINNAIASYRTCDHLHPVHTITADDHAEPRSCRCALDAGPSQPRLRCRQRTRHEGSPLSLFFSILLISRSCGTLFLLICLWSPFKQRLVIAS